MKSIILIAVIAFSVTTFSASAQFNNKSLRDENRHFNRGMHNGQLTKHEAFKLKKQKAAIRKDAIRYKTNNGRIGARESAHLKRDQRKLDHQIFKQRHDKQRRF